MTKLNYTLNYLNQHFKNEIGLTIDDLQQLENSFY